MNKSPQITLYHEMSNSTTCETKPEETKIVKTNLSVIFNYCLDVLRNNEHLTGDKALRILAYMLDLRLLEPHFGNKIEIDTYNYDFSSYEDNLIESHKAKLLRFVRFSNLAKEKEDNIPKILRCVCDEILSVHPLTKPIFKGKCFDDIQHQSTYKKLIDKLISFNFEAIDEDILGEAYEEVIKDVMTGKVLGQFFTPPIVKQMMIKLIDPQLNPDGTIETIFDPAMGTGGFLISSLRHLFQQSKKTGISLNWDFISNEGLGGREAEPDTFQLAISNMLISSGHMFNVLEKGDSIRNPITNKYDIVFANPPFGINGLIYNEIIHPLRNEYMPIKSNSAVPLFLQAIIHILKINGRAAVVLPDGKELFSKSNELIAIREYLLKTCDLREIIYLPSGVFTHTSIKTCVFYFVKKCEGKDVLETKIKISKTQKETGREYTFSKTLQTENVSFYNYDSVQESKTLLVEVPVEKIVENSYSLNYAEYLENKTNQEHNDMVVVKTLGEVCDFNIGGTPSRSNNDYYENGNNLWVSVRDLNGGYIYDSKEKITDLGVKNSSVKLFEKDTVLFSFKLSIGKTAIVGNPLYTNEAIAGIQSKNNDVLSNKYLYYYLTINDFTKLGSGLLGNGSLNKKSLEIIELIIPSLKTQEKLVNYLDFIYETANKASLSKIEILKKSNKLRLFNQQSCGGNTTKPLGEVCEFQNGYSFKSSIYEIQNDTNIGIVQIKSIQNGFIDKNKITEYIEENNKYKSFEIQKGDILIALSGATTGKIGIYNLQQKSYLNQRVGKINAKVGIYQKYIYYWYVSCNIDEKVLGLSQGTAQPNVSTNDISNIKIPIPSLKTQEEIVAYCEKNNQLIQLLEQEIEDNKREAEKYMKNIVKQPEELPEEMPENEIV